MPGASKPVEGMEAGDTVYVRHPTIGVSTVKVRAVGKHGFQADGEDGQRHKLHHESYLGHKARALHTYELVDEGADGVVVERGDGVRRFLRGELPKAADTAEPGDEAGGAAKEKDPLLAGLDELAEKALRPVGDLSAWFMKAGPRVQFDPSKHKRGQPKNAGQFGPGGGGGAKPVNAPAGGPMKAGPSAKGAPLHKHGDKVRFRHGDVEGSGEIVASGQDGVTVKTEDGREHQVRHDALLPPSAEDKKDRAASAEKKAEEAKPSPAAATALTSKTLPPDRIQTDIGGQSVAVDVNPPAARLASLLGTGKTLRIVRIGENDFAVGDGRSLVHDRLRQVLKENGYEAPEVEMSAANKQAFMTENLFLLPGDNIMEAKPNFTLNGKPVALLNRQMDDSFDTSSGLPTALMRLLKPITGGDAK